MAMIDEAVQRNIVRANAYMARAYAISEHSTCPAAKVGALLVTDEGVNVEGVNGGLIETCAEFGCVAVPATATTREYSRHLHAEMDVLLSCARLGIATDNAELFVTKLPCYDCMKFIIHAGIHTVWFPCGPNFPNPVGHLADACGMALLGL